MEAAQTRKAHRQAATCHRLAARLAASQPPVTESLSEWAILLSECHCPPQGAFSRLSAIHLVSPDGDSPCSKIVGSNSFDRSHCNSICHPDTVPMRVVANILHQTRWRILPTRSGEEPKNLCAGIHGYQGEGELAITNLLDH